MKGLARILGIFLLIMVSSSSFAQDVQFGFKGGLSLTTLGVDAPDGELKLGFLAGPYAILKASDKIAIQPELVYAAQGMKVSNDGTGKYNYVNLPVILKWYPTADFNFQAGPQLGLLTSAKLDDVDVSDQLNTLDFAFGLGFGVSSNNIDLDFRYNLGLSNTAKNDEKLPNRVIQFSIGYRFN
ncbi:MAG: porin family protein, partial [Flammeovirgaceae bacterium]